MIFQEVMHLPGGIIKSRQWVKKEIDTLLILPSLSVSSDGFQHNAC